MTSVTKGARLVRAGGPTALLSRSLALLGVLVALVFATALSGNAQAMPTGSLGWRTIVAPGTWGYRDSPDAACRLQHSIYAPHSVYRGYRDTATYNTTKACIWTPVFGDSGASSVDLVCDTGYTLNRSALRCENTSYPDLGKRCSVNGGGSAPATTANPIDILTGSKRFQRVDFQDSADHLSLRRLYSSRPYSGAPSALKQTPIGLANWLFDFQYELQFSGDWLVYYRASLGTPDGTVATFQRQTGGAMVAHAPYAPQKDYTLEFVGTWPVSLSNLTSAQTTWKLTDADDTVWVLQTFLNPINGKYDVARPISRRTRSGLEWTFTYGSAGMLTQIQDSYGKTISFTWLTITYGSASVPVGVSEITLPSGNKLVYSYETSGGLPATTVTPDRLVKVELKDPLGVVKDATTYSYDDTNLPTFVTGEWDRDLVRRWTVTYDAAGRATKSAGPADAFSADVAYGANGSTFTRTVTNALGKDTIYTFAQPTTNAARLTTVAGQASAHCPAGTASYSYNADKLISSTTDEEGRVTNYTRNARGRPTQVVEAFGTPSVRTTNMTWHATFNVPTQIVRPGLTTDLTYDASGRLLTVTETDTTSFTTPYATNGRTRTWTYSWSTTGQLLTTDGPLAGTGDTLTYVYGADGYLDSVTDQVGLVTTITSVDWRGAPLTVQDANGVQTVFTYDIRGRVLSATLDPGPAQSAYAFEYTAVGNIAKITLPGGGWLEYSYDDASRVTGVENNRGETQAFVNNDAGAPTAITVKDASSTTTRQQTLAYDELGRIIQSIGAGAQTTSFAYDKVNNLTQVTDARGKVFAAGFDPLNRLISETDPDSHVQEYAYNGQDVLTAFDDARSLTTSRKVDGYGRLIEEVSPDRGTLTYWYDKADKVTKIVDGDGVQTDFTYDASGRRLTATFPSASAENVTYTYDSVAGGNVGKGRLTSVNDETGASAYRWDEQGRLVAETKIIQAQTYALGYAYDVNGQVTEITLPSGRTVAYTRDSDGLVSAVSTKATPVSSSTPLASSFAWQPFGQLKSLVYGNGLSLDRTYDLNSWLQRVEVKATGVSPLDLTFGRNANGELTSVTDNASTGRAATYGYTNAGWLNVANGAWGDDSYSYDAAGNRSQSSRTIGGVTTTAVSTIPGTNNRITEIRDGSSVLKRSLDYRSGGAVIEDERIGDAVYAYDYNARGRMISAAKDGVDVGHYGYDAFGRRVWRETFGTGALSLHYIFDTNGHLLAEHDAATGHVLREYVWLEDEPLAVIDYSTGSPAIFYMHTGQIGEPLVMTDAGKAKVWDVAIEPFGVATLFGAASEALDLRLPGQWLQVETGGLLQNWRREYDPSLGRYAQADPLGIDAGQNLYAYAYGTPLTLTDPEGLGIRGAAWGAAFGGPVGGIVAGAGGGSVSFGTLAVPAGYVGFGLGAATGAAVGSLIEDIIYGPSQNDAAPILCPLPTIDARVNGNSLSSPRPTWVYTLRSRSPDNRVLKYGITSQPIAQRRYPGPFYDATNSYMDELESYPNRRTARYREMTKHWIYFINNGRFPELTIIP